MKIEMYTDDKLPNGFLQKLADVFESNNIELKNCKLKIHGSEKK